MAKAKKKARKTATRKRKPTLEELAVSVKGVLSDREIALATAFVRKTPSISQVERDFELPERYGWKILKRPRVVNFMERLAGARLTVQEDAIEAEEEKAFEGLTACETALLRVVRSAPHPTRGCGDILGGVKMGLEYYGGILKPPADTPGQQIANQIAAQQQVHVHVGQGQGEGESVYRSAWIRQQRGIVDPASEAIDKEYGGIDSLPSQSSSIKHRSVSDGAAHDEPALETADPGTMEGAE